MLKGWILLLVFMFENYIRIQIFIVIMTSLQVELLESLSLGPGVLRCSWCFGAWSDVLPVGLHGVWRCPLVGRIPRKVATWGDGSLRSWPSGSSAETSSCGVTPAWLDFSMYGDAFSWVRFLAKSLRGAMLRRPFGGLHAMFSCRDPGSSMSSSAFS